MEWHLGSDALTIVEGRTTRVPSAIEIWKAAFNQEGPLAATIEEAPVDFSRYPIGFRLAIQMGPPGFCLKAEVETTEGWLSLDGWSEREADHVVSGGVWHPLPQGVLDEARSVLSDIGVEDPGHLTLGEVIELRKVSEQSPSIVVDCLTDLEAERIAEQHDSTLNASFNGTLYPYQEVGRRWLSYILDQGIGGILGDEMGLGKTVQIIAALQSGPAGKTCTPVLIGCPNTLLENWRRELKRFWPDCEVYVHQGPDRLAFPEDLRSFDVILTSYGLLRRDAPMLEMVQWRAVILDEAQAIKNPEAKRTRAAKRLPRQAAIAMTGTPLENHLLDLWSLGDFVLPGYLGSQAAFERKYEDSPEGARRLKGRVSPVVLRRRVREVANDLPDKIEVPQALRLPPSDVEEYEAIRESIASQAEGGAAFAMLAKLRQFCSHPFLIRPAYGDPVRGSVKYRRLVEVVEEILASDEKAVVFSSFVGMLDLIETDIARRFSVYTTRLDGSVPQSERQGVVDEFSGVSGSAVLAINPVVGGVGLNITAANHVIHYTPEWNPAVQDQATARAYRRGQERPVTVYTPYYVDTVESVIQDRLERKRKMFTEAVPEGEETADLEDLMAAIAITPARESV